MQSHAGYSLVILRVCYKHVLLKSETRAKKTECDNHEPLRLLKDSMCRCIKTASCSKTPHITYMYIRTVHNTNTLQCTNVNLRIVVIFLMDEMTRPNVSII